MVILSILRLHELPKVHLNASTSGVMDSPVMLTHASVCRTGLMTADRRSASELQKKHVVQNSPN